LPIFRTQIIYRNIIIISRTELFVGDDISSKSEKMYFIDLFSIKMLFYGL